MTGPPSFTPVLWVLMAASTASSQSFHLGRCPSPSVQNDFNITKYLGTWYEIQKLPAVFERGICNQATYSPLSDGTVLVRNAELLSNGQLNSIEAVAKVREASQPAILDVTFFTGVPDSPYWVLSTDYQTYAVVYSCSDYLGVFHVDFAWILARTRTLADDIVGRLHDDLKAVGLDVNRLTVSNQTACDAMA
ncbi:apolipoprotein D-like [Aplochiton taeniatus]